MSRTICVRTLHVWPVDIYIYVYLHIHVDIYIYVRYLNSDTTCLELFAFGLYMSGQLIYIYICIYIYMLIYIYMRAI